MKFSEGLFKIPVRIRDSFSVMKSLLKEDKMLREEEDLDDIQPEHGDWIMGYAKIPIEEIKSWSDTYLEGSDLEAIARDGFQETLVITKTLGNFDCMWPREKFEEALDEFADKYTKAIEQIVEDAMLEKARAVASQPRKRRFFF